MYTIERSEFRATDPKRIVPFVKCWEHYYSGNVRLPRSSQLIDYFLELNLGSVLSEQNVVRLLRWKDQRMLTHPKQGANGKTTTNPRVESVLSKLEDINSFRLGRTRDENFKNITKGIFPKGVIWQLFLFHIAQPWSWPIADQHVFRAFRVPAPKNIDEFCNYRDRFGSFAETFRRQLHVDEQDKGTVVKANKRLDNALMAYGQFLKKYDR